MQIADALRLAIQHLNAGRDAEASELCARILEVQPSNPVANALTARAARRAGDPGRARSHVDTALAAAPDYLPARTLDAQLAEDDASVAAAECAYRRLLTLEPASWSAWYDYGNLRQARAEDPAGSLAPYRRALALAPAEDKPAMNLATAALKLADSSAALAACEGVLARQPSHVRANALAATCLYDMGRTAEADRLVGWGSLTRTYELPLPAGYPDLAAFNRALAAAVRGHPGRRDDWDPTKRAIRGGALVTDVLKHDDPAIRAFSAALAVVLDRYVKDLPDPAGDPEHPHLRAIPSGYALDAWGNILGDGGHQSGHIHNLGWLSGVYYVEMPPAVQDDDPERAGWIEFNRPGYGIPDTGRATVRTLRPEAGVLALFPSYVWHRTVPFAGGGERISIAFDLHPR
ncbi:putative 2OG-Fe(II) oxygenase [Thalassobaculum sp.]|uniref:putative 2OG-Fe(II) oxygenase n=1 Tax=Thalassobaculum sp. TaxID=2022740 RepID=UPI0032EBA89B